MEFQRGEDFDPGRPELHEYSQQFANYIDRVAAEDVRSQLVRQLSNARPCLSDLKEDVASTRHAPYTWSVKQVLGHTSDCERVFAYRALRIGRGDTTDLPGFDENQFMAAAHFDSLPASYLWQEFETVRCATLSLVQQFSAVDWRRLGNVSGGPMSCRAMVFALAGHAEHHLAILARRLGKNP